MKSNIAIRAWDLGDSLLEHYRYGVGKPEIVEPHAHDVYQLCISVDAPGEYTYRGAAHAVPSHAVSIIHPGEIHSARDLGPRISPANFWMLYFPMTLWQKLAAPSGWRETSAPFFSEPVITAPLVFSRIARLPPRLAAASSQLERETLLAQGLQLLSAHVLGAKKTPVQSRFYDLRELARVRDFLESCPAGNPSLVSLANMAGLSAWHFCRTFKKYYLLPPHTYLLQVRLRLAKRLLIAGRSLGEVAAHVGFADQSHLNRHFRKTTGCTPGRYFPGSNIVQDGNLIL